MQHSHSFTPAPFLRTLSALLVFAVAVSAQRHYTVVNNCPSAIDLYIGDAKDSTLAKGASTSKVLGYDAGFFYTTANGGKTDGSATRAGFFGDHGASYYYIVKDVADFNTGISIKPNHPEVCNSLCASEQWLIGTSNLQRQGFCPEIRCDDVFCRDAFIEAPTGFPRTAVRPPLPPIYSCPFRDVAYTIT